MNSRYSAAASFALVLALAIVCRAQALAPRPLPSVDELLARHIRATGGQARWAAARTQIRQGVALPDLGSLPLRTFARATGEWAFQLTLAGDRVLRHGFDGQRGWEDAQPPRRMTAAQAFDKTLVYSPFWVLHFGSYFPKSSLKGTQRNGEQELYVVEATTPAGRTLTLNFDAGTGLLTRAGKVVFDDYREVSGLKAPFLVRFGWQTIAFSDIRNDAPVDDASLAAPAALAPASQALPSVGEVIEKYLNALGGLAALGKIKSETRTGTLKHGDETIKVESFSRAPDLWLLVATFGPARIERQGYDGKTAWKQTPDLVKEMDSDDTQQLAGFLDLALPLKLKQSRATMTVLGKETMGSGGAYVVDWEAPDGSLANSLSTPVTACCYASAACRWKTIGKWMVSSGPSWCAPAAALKCALRRSSMARWRSRSLDSRVRRRASKSCLRDWTIPAL